MEKSLVKKHRNPAYKYPTCFQLEIEHYQNGIHTILLLNVLNYCCIIFVSMCMYVCMRVAMHLSVRSVVQIVQAVGSRGVPTDRPGLLPQPQGDGECLTICPCPFSPVNPEL